MNGFHFRLERVLRWRALELAAEETKLRRVIEEGAQVDRALKAIQDAMSEIPRQLAMEREFSGADLNNLAACAGRLTKERDRAIERRNQKRREIAGQTEAHRRAKQRHRLLLEFKDRKYSEWKVEVARELDLLAEESHLARWEG